MKKLALPLIVIGLIYGFQQSQIIEFNGVTEAPPERLSTAADSIWQSGNQVRSSGTVDRILSDDNDGSRHQRFILKLSSGRTILVAHNIDLAPRIPSLRIGDSIVFYGQFESNPQGGVIHWTHRDPRGRHADGWLEHNGRRYQ
jgi:hypothetical protein